MHAPDSAVGCSGAVRANGGPEIQQQLAVASREQLAHRNPVIVFSSAVVPAHKAEQLPMPSAKVKDAYWKHSAAGRLTA